MKVWKNQLHKTTARSTLNKEKLEEIEQRLQAGYIASNDKDARKLKRLFEILCPHKLQGCSCRTMMYQDY